MFTLNWKFLAVGYICHLLLTEAHSLDIDCHLDLVKPTEREWPPATFIDRHDIIEYDVDYINFKTNRSLPYNGTRFQPWRWFSINDDALNELRLYFDYFSGMTRIFYDTETVAISVNETPSGCLNKLSFDELDQLTRSFLLNDIKPPNNRLCSAHVEKYRGSGRLSYSCCELNATLEIECVTVQEGHYLLVLHSAAIFTTCLLMVVFSSVMFQPEIGNEDAHLYPVPADRFKIKISGQKCEIDNVEIPRNVYQKMPDLNEKISSISSIDGANDFKLERITLTVNKKKLCNDSLAITFTRCLSEFFTDVNSSYVRNNERHCCLLIVSRIALFVCYGALALPALFYLILYKDDDNKQLRDTFDANKNISCSFYVENRFWTVLSFIIGYAFIVILPRVSCYPNYCTCIINELEWRNHKESCTCSCNKVFNLSDKVFNILSIAMAYIVVGFGTYVTTYIVIRVLLLARSNKSISDEILLAVSPVMGVVTSKIYNVTLQYGDITQKVIRLLRQGKTLFYSRKEIENKAVGKEGDKNVAVGKEVGTDVEGGIELGKNVADITTTVNGIREENEACIIQTDSKAKIEMKFVRYFGVLLLRINRPLVIVKPRGRLLISRRLVSQMYSEPSETLPFEISNYLKAATLWSLLSCSFLGILVFLVLIYGSMYSLSKDWSEIIAGSLIVVTWTYSTIKDLIKDTFKTSSEPDYRFEDDLKYNVTHFDQSWTVYDIKIIVDRSKFPTDTRQNDPPNVPNVSGQAASANHPKKDRKTGPSNNDYKETDLLLLNVVENDTDLLNYGSTTTTI